MVSMSKNAHLVYPHQLFKAELLPEGVHTVFVIEDPLYFGSDAQYPVFFHKQKLILHRASMQRYIEEVLWPQKYEVEYIEFDQLHESGDILQKLRGFDRVTLFDVVDDVLQRRLQAAAETVPDVPTLTMLESPSFYLKRAEVASYFKGSSKALFGDFYQWQRERFNVLIDSNYKPVGGKWQHEPASNIRLAKDQDLPTFAVFGSNKYVEDARHYVQKNFPNNPGEDADFSWATNHAEAEQWLKEFVHNRLQDYGLYQNAIDGHAPWTFHSALSPALNCGLLTPQQVVHAALEVHAKEPLPLESLEGFIRQVLGWREYVRGMYTSHGVAMRSANLFAHKRKLTQDWYQGTTGIPPVDDVIHKVKARGYIHNVERLMVIGNLMFLSQIDPKEAYQWFTEMCVDAYDWVVVPNVYAISQYADGGTMAEKPNLSDSEYVLRMSHYEKGEWSDAWDGLFWNFIEANKVVLANNPHNKKTLAEVARVSEDRRRIAGYRASDFLNNKTKES